MVAELLISVDKRFQFVIGEKQLEVATLLDSRFKIALCHLKYVSACLSSWLTKLSRKEDQKEIPMKHVEVGAPQLPQWDVFDQVIQGFKTPTTDPPVSDSVEANRALVIQMISVYVAELMIDRMSDRLKWWAENGVKKAPIARQFLYHHQLVCRLPSEHLFSGAGLI